MNSGDVAWILAAGALLCIMIPGLALFYGGMVGSRRILNMMMMCFGGMSIVAVLWAVFGYSMVFGNSVGGAGLIGDVSEYFGMEQLLAEDPDAPIPAALFAAFQLFFAGITTAIIAGAAAGRMKFGAWMTFAALWATLVYFPVAHWVFAFSSADGSVTGGWIVNSLKAVDFAGGTAVHMNAGIAALALALVLGRSAGWPKSEHTKPHSRPLVLVGAGLLWAGWFGFNAGSALTAGQSASVVFLNTVVAAAAGLLAWTLVERLRLGSASSMGAASGLISALVAITPACGAVSPLGALAIGVIAGAVCSLAIELKFRLGFDDSLDVVGVHLVGGIIGTLLIGFFATDAAPSKVNGLFYGGGFGLLGIQALATLAVLAYSFGVTWVIAKVLSVTMGLRIHEADELRGIDIAAHSEAAYLSDEEPVQLGSPTVPRPTQPPPSLRLPSRSIVRSDCLPRVPWKNGAGTTREVAVFPAPAGPTFWWRISVADICEDAGFSTFAGADRHFVVASPGFLHLDVDGNRRNVAHYQPEAFPGEAQVSVKLVTGPTTAINLITDRSTCAGAIDVQHLDGHLIPHPKAVALVLLAGSAGTNDGLHLRPLDVLMLGAEWERILFKKAVVATVSVWDLPSESHKKLGRMRLTLG